MTINDIWGTIKIEPCYEKIINSKEFISLKNKVQLGLNCNDNSVHTRYQHSLGVYYLACKLIDICKNKFSKILDITLEDEQAIKCMALVHDIGHGCFSHVSEKFLNGTHEDNTISILLDKNSEINKAIVDTFGEKVLEKTISLIKMKEKIKDKNLIKTEPNLIFIIGKLLSGGIDIDRMDYMFRDSKHVTKETNDFSSILDSIKLEYIDDDLEIVFSSDAEYKIANFFNKRFELYDTLYLDNKTRVMEAIFGKFLEKTNINLNWNTTEIEMNNLFRRHMESEDLTIKRYANLLTNKKLDNNFIIREINNATTYDFYKKRLYSLIPELEKYSNCIFESYCNASIYNSKNKIFIDKDGLIKEISESSKILNSELKKDKYIISIDLQLLRKSLELDNVPLDKINDIIERVKKVTSTEIEQEKKYTFKSINPCQDFKKIVKALNLNNPKFIENIDTYYDYNNILETYRINVRKRECDGRIEYTVKRPLNDKSSISKREEKSFSSLEEIIEFLQKEWKIPIKDLKEKIKLKTKRAKYDLECYDGTFEIVFDKTTSILNGKDYRMIECELKSGNSSFLYFIDKIIKSFDFIEECKLSKKEIAMEQNNLIDTNYDEQIKTFFIGSTELLEQLNVLARKKEEIISLREQNGGLKKPLIVTITGTPRAGKTTCIDNLFEFLKKSDLKTTCLEEPAGLIYQTLKTKDEKQQLLKDRVGFVERQYELGKEYIDKNLCDSDIILCDRGILDPFVWYDMYYQQGLIDTKKYEEFLKKLKELAKYNNQFYALFADVEESMKRDYLNSLSLEPRTTMNQENVSRYNTSLIRMLPIIEKEVESSKLIDTTKCGRMEPSIAVATDVLDKVKKMYRS